MVLIMLIWWVASEYFWKPKTLNQQTSKTNTQSVAKTTENQSQPKEEAVLSTDSLIVSSVELQDHILLENEHLKLSFTNRGGNLNSIIVKDFTNSDKKTPVQLIPENASLLNVSLSSAKGTQALDAYNLKHEIIKTDSTQSIEFYIEDAQNNRVFRKVITLKDDYNLDFRLINNNYADIKAYSISFASGINLTEDNPASVKDKKNTFKVVSQVNNEYKDVALSRIIKDIAKFKTENESGAGPKVDEFLKHEGRIDWAAVRSKYFIYALVPEKKIESKNIEITAKNDSPAFKYNVQFSKNSTTFEDYYSLYLGPVDYHRLASYNNGMEDIAELGGNWIRWISKFFLKFLTFINKFISNWGIVIIIFALFLKVLLTPLTNKTMSSAKKMQEINPLMKEIQQQYKSDPIRMNQELKKLYKEHKVSPLGGCLPILLQMPIFFALYPVLKNSIDLRQASFFGWLTDLSEPDAYWILPILMGVSMFVQQKMSSPKNTPEELQRMDDTQKAQIQSQKMMLYIMPVFMFFIFKSLPSGLVLYWMVFNVFQIAQQLYQDYKKKAVR